MFWGRLQFYDNFIGQKVVIEGTVEEDAVYGYKLQTEFYVKDIVIENIKLPGRVRVSGFGPIEVRRNDHIKATGFLRDGFGSYQGTVSFAEYAVENRNTDPIDEFRRNFIATSYTYLPEPQASLGLGFLAGFRTLLPDGLTDDLSTTGLTHIVAVSGYNTTIIASAVHALMARRGSRWQVVFATLGTLAIFITITGAAPSIMRASVVSTLALLGWYYGKSFKPSVLILGSAALTAWINPLHLWYSIGWWLSFLAFFGVLVIAPTVTARFFKKQPNLLLKTAIETTSAQIMALPLIVWVFGKVSAISIFANMLVLPMIPIAMLLTFAVGAVAMVWPLLASILVWPATYVLSYITDIISWLARVSWALTEVDISKSLMVLLYLGVLFIVWVMRRKVALLRRKLYTLY